MYRYILSVIVAGSGGGGGASGGLRIGTRRILRGSG